MGKEPDQDLLRRVGWLATVPAELQEAVLARCDVLHVEASRRVYHFGDDMGGIVGVVSGQLAVHGKPQGDEPTLLYIGGPGFWTGEFSTATGEQRKVALIAYRDATLVRLPRAEFLRIASALPLAWQQLAILSTRNSVLLLELLSIARRSDPVSRLAQALTLLLREVLPPSRSLTISQLDLGAIARMSRGGVSAAMHRLQDLGLIAAGYRGVEVLDPAGLAAFGNDE
jgi:CRP-like cAMP-binding protein